MHLPSHRSDSQASAYLGLPRRLLRVPHHLPSVPRDRLGTASHLGSRRYQYVEARRRCWLPAPLGHPRCERLRRRVQCRMCEAAVICVRYFHVLVRVFAPMSARRPRLRLDLIGDDGRQRMPPGAETLDGPASGSGALRVHAPARDEAGDGCQHCRCHAVRLRSVESAGGGGTARAATARRELPPAHTRKHACARDVGV